MRVAKVFVDRDFAATLVEHSRQDYELIYEPGYSGPSISLTLPRSKSTFKFDHFPTFFEGLLPEGVQLAALLRQKKIDERDYFSQLVAVGEDLVGNVTVKAKT